MTAEWSETADQAPSARPTSSAAACFRAPRSSTSLPESLRVSWFSQEEPLLRILMIVPDFLGPTFAAPGAGVGQCGSRDFGRDGSPSCYPLSP